MRHTMTGEEQSSGCTTTSDPADTLENNEALLMTADQSPSEAHQDEGAPQSPCSTSSMRLKRPRNSFFIWSASVRQDLVLLHPSLKLPEISKLLGQKWHQLESEERRRFEQMARKEKEEFLRKHPDYKFRPKPKKRRAETAVVTSEERLMCDPRHQDFLLQPAGVPRSTMSLFPTQTWRSANPSSQMHVSGVAPIQAWRYVVPSIQACLSGIAPDRIQRTGNPPAMAWSSGIPPTTAWINGINPTPAWRYDISPDQACVYGISPTQAWRCRIPPSQTWRGVIPNDLDAFNRSETLEDRFTRANNHNNILGTLLTAPRKSDSTWKTVQAWRSCELSSSPSKTSWNTVQTFSSWADPVYSKASQTQRSHICTNVYLPDEFPERRARPLGNAIHQAIGTQFSNADFQGAQCSSLTHAASSSQLADGVEGASFAEVPGIVCQVKRELIDPFDDAPNCRHLEDPLSGPCADIQIPHRLHQVQGRLKVEMTSDVQMADDFELDQPCRVQHHQLQKSCSVLDMEDFSGRFRCDGPSTSVTDQLLHSATGSCEPNINSCAPDNSSCARDDNSFATDNNSFATHNNSCAPDNNSCATDNNSCAQDNTSYVSGSNSCVSNINSCKPDNNNRKLDISSHKPDNNSCKPDNATCKPHTISIAVFPDLDSCTTRALDHNSCSAGNLEINICSAGNLEIDSCTAGNPEIDSCTAGNPEIDSCTAGNPEIDSCRAVARMFSWCLRPLE